jgi:hypothetical protein
MAKRSKDSIFIDVIAVEVNEAMRAFELGQAASGYNLLHDLKMSIQEHQEASGGKNGKKV